MSRLPNYTILDPGVLTLPKPELDKLQAERLVNMVRYVYEYAPFWKQKFDHAGIKPEDIRGLEDLQDIPFCTKQDLQEDQAAHPPYGSYTASPPEEWRKYFSTSGTTGTPVRRVFSKRDWSYVLDRFARSPINKPGDIYFILGPTDGLMGPSAGSQGLERCEAMVVHGGRYSTREKIKLIRDLRPSVVSGSASYLLHMLDIAREMGIDLSTCGVKAVNSVGEPGSAIESTRQRLNHGWGAFVADGFGLTEIFALGGNCPKSTSLHLPDDMVITEIIHPDTGEPVADGTPGEVVYTNIICDTQPLLRYRSRDIARSAGDEPCTCGSTHKRLVNSIEGRIDDMIWFKGVNIFPSLIESTIRSFDGVGNLYQIFLSGPQSAPDLTVRCEYSSPQAGVERNQLQRKIIDALNSNIGVRADVELLEPGSLPRPDDDSKLRHVVDHRTA